MRGLVRSKAWRTRRFWIDHSHSILVLMTYVLLVVSRLLETVLLDRQNEYLGVILLQLLIFLIPGLIYCKLRGSAFPDQLRLRLPRPAHVLLLVFATLTLIFGCLLIGAVTGGLSGSEQGFSLYETFSAKGTSTAGEVIYLLLAYALLPAVCEELVYRGILCAALEERGLFCAVTYSALSFAMLHFDFANFPVYLFAGLLLCAVMYATRSLFAAVLLHLAYNVFGLFGQRAIGSFYAYAGSTKLFTFLLSLAFLLSAVLFCGEAARIYRAYAKAGVLAPYRVDLPREERRHGLLQTFFGPISLVCMGVYLLACIFW